MIFIMHTSCHKRFHHKRINTVNESTHQETITAGIEKTVDTQLRTFFKLGLFEELE